MTTSRSCSASARPRLPKHELIAVAALVVAAAFASSAVADTAERDAALCGSLAASARDALSLGYPDEAADLLDEALSFVPSDSDANYLRALLGLSRGESAAQAAAMLETAIASRRFGFHSPESATVLYSALLVRMRRPADALRFIEDLPASSEVLHVRTIAALALGDDEGGRQAVLASLKRYPVDARPLLAWLRSRNRPVVSRADAAVVEAGFAALEKLKEADRGILIALAPYAGSPDDARLLVREFRAGGGASAAATILALRLGLVTEERAIGEMLSGEYALDDGSMETLYAQLSSDDSRSLFRRTFSTFSGDTAMDHDHDGFNESTTRYESGQPVFWALDDNQDGVPELEVSFFDGVPRTAGVRSGSTDLEIHYDSWPCADQLDFSASEGVRRYLLGPGVLALPVIALLPVSGAHGAPYRVGRSGFTLPTELSVGRLAYARETFGDGKETVELADGEPARAWWTDLYRRTGYAVYRNGLPSAEVVDADADGRFESRRVWLRGPDGVPLAAYMETDLDGDGLYEYRESLSGPSLRSWDYDGDGAVDLTLRVAPDGSLVYRYLGVRGRTTEAVYRSGLLETVLENGVPMALIGDAGGSVVWIGAKPFDFGPATPLPGRGSRNGAMYTVFSIEGTLYAQMTD